MSTTTPAIPSPGFADPTRESQRAFRAVLDALAHPGRSYALVGPAQPPAALGRGLGAVALTVLDEDSSVWLGGALAADGETAAWLAFHTGATIAERADAADFAFAAPAAVPALGALRLGTDEAPHLSTTVVLDVRAGRSAATAQGAVARPAPSELRSQGQRFIATGPGIDGTTEVAAPWAAPDFATQWAANHALFPRGVDLLLVDEDTVSALPRTTRLEAASDRPGISEEA